MSGRSGDPPVPTVTRATRRCRIAGVHWYCRPVRACSVGLLLIAGLATAGCSGSTTAPTTTVTSRAPKPAGAVPSSISVQVCSHEAQREMADALGETATVSVPTWTDHRYSCSYAYPSSTPTGSFTVTVTELSSWSETYAYYDGLATSMGKSRDLESLGQAAFQTSDGSVVVRKDWKVLVVDNSGLPPQFGVPPTSSSAVAVTVADVILGCWAGD